MKMHAQARSSSARRRGFTLIELICSIAILATVAGLSMPLTRSMFRGNLFNNTLVGIGQSIEMGRQHAIANNTYTWVLLSEPADGEQSMYVAVVESRNGSDTLAWQTSQVALTAVPDLRLVSPLTPVPAATLTDTADSLPNMPDTTESTPGRWAKVKLDINSGPAKKITFTRALQFTPTGQAMSSTTLARYIQMTVAGKTSTTAQKAVLLVGGLTGRSQLYRP